MLQLQKCCPHLKFMNGGVSMKSGGSGGGVSIVHLPEEGAQHHISWFALMLGDKIWLSPSLRCAYMHDDDACPPARARPSPVNDQAFGSQTVRVMFPLWE